MPFDAMVATKPSLADYLERQGITPVPMTVLAAHKAAQLRRYRADWLATPWPYIGFFALASAWEFGAIDGPLYSRIPTALAGGVFFLFIAVIITNFIIVMHGRKIYGRARWVEGNVCRHVPQPIRDIAMRVQTSLPCNLIYGELVRKEVVLDPYLVVQMDDESACLGIWDGDHIIACAKG